MRISDWSSDVCSSDLGPDDQLSDRIYRRRHRAFNVSRRIMAEECCIGPVRPNEVDGAIRDRTEAARRDEEHRPPCLRNGPRCNASDALTDLVELENEGDADILPAPYLVTLKDKQIFAASKDRKIK